MLLLSSSTLSRYARFVVGLLAPVALLNYPDRRMLATMKASIDLDIPSMVKRPIGKLHGSGARAAR